MDADKKKSKKKGKSKHSKSHRNLSRNSSKEKVEGDHTDMTETNEGMKANGSKAKENVAKETPTKVQTKEETFQEGTQVKSKDQTSKEEVPSKAETQGQAIEVPSKEETQEQAKEETEETSKEQVQPKEPLESDAQEERRAKEKEMEEREMRRIMKVQQFQTRTRSLTLSGDTRLLRSASVTGVRKTPSTESVGFRRSSVAVGPGAPTTTSVSEDIGKFTPASSSGVGFRRSSSVVGPGTNAYSRSQTDLGKYLPSSSSSAYTPRRSVAAGPAASGSWKPLPDEIQYLAQHEAARAQERNRLSFRRASFSVGPGTSSFRDSESSFVPTLEKSESSDPPPLPSQPYSYVELLQKPRPKDVDPTKLETYLGTEEFLQVFGMTREDFWKLPVWKRTELKKAVNLF